MLGILKRLTELGSRKVALLHVSRQALQVDGKAGHVDALTRKYIYARPQEGHISHLIITKVGKDLSQYLKSKTD